MCLHNIATVARAATIAASSSCTSASAGPGKSHQTMGSGWKLAFWTENLRYVHFLALGTERSTQFPHPCNCTQSWGAAIFIKALQSPHCENSITRLTQTSRIYVPYLLFKITPSLLGLWDSPGSRAGGTGCWCLCPVSPPPWAPLTHTSGHFLLHSKVILPRWPCSLHTA